MEHIDRIAIIGGGSWATALVKIFSECGIRVHWYLRSPEVVATIKEKGKNPNYLTFLSLNRAYIYPTADIEEAVQAAEFVLFSVPSAYLESTVSPLKTDSLEDKQVILSIKGIVPHYNLTPSEFIRTRFTVPMSNQFLISGPCHAEEVALERKTFMTISGLDTEKVRVLCNSVTLDYIKTVASDDPVGIEFSSIMKNVIGIACGIARGLNYGDNFQAVLVSNALKEVDTFLKAMDDRKRDLYQSAYFGDLLVTAYSELSRNRIFGQLIGRGFTVELAQSETKMVAEGYYAVKGIYKMAKELKKELPVVSLVYRILYNKISPYFEFKLLEQLLT